MMKKAGKRISALIALVASFAVFLWLNDLMRLKQAASDSVRSFYAERADSIDIIFAGTSHVYYGISPMQLWEEQGYTSYVLATSSQPLPATYYLLKEAIRTQHPGMVVLDSWGARYTNGCSDLNRLHLVVDSIPLGSTWIEMFRDYINQYVDKEKRLEFYFPLIRTHGRWQDLMESDFRPSGLFAKGYYASKVISKQKEPRLVDEVTPISSVNELYMNKIMDLCEENDVRLVVCTIPSPMQNRYEWVHRQANGLLEVAGKRGVPTLDLEHYRKEIGLVYEQDYADEAHLNYCGARKLTGYLGNWLKENYDLPDHREDPDYASWKRDYDLFCEYVDGLEEQSVQEDVSVSSVQTENSQS